jgi:anti-sigma regulatory factor (Ser/Thr protein kinase)
MSFAAPGDQVVGESALTHDALLYRSPEEYSEGVLSFVRAGLSAGLPVLVAVPEPNLERLRTALSDAASSVTFADMMTIGRNPARIIPAIQRFVDASPDRRVRFVGEPQWPGRSPAGAREATRHEAMLNDAFAGAALDLLCPYDVGRLPPEVVADALRTHPTLVDVAQRRASPSFTDPSLIYTDDDPLVPSPPNDVPVMVVRADDLAAVRRFVHQGAADLGLEPRRTHDLVLAVNEIATNTILHTAGSGTLRIWSKPDTVVCEIRDGGYIADAFAGRRPPNDASDHGRGLWMANELCDLVQLRSTERGTTIRVHIDR